MKKRIYRKLVTFFCLLTVLSISGCSGKPEYEPKTSAIDANTNYMAEAEYNPSVNSKTEIMFNEPVADDQTALVGTGETSAAVSNAIIDQRKIIRNANISLEVDNFDVAYGKIEYIISNVGYVQESKIGKVKHYVDNKEVLVTNGVIVIRVDSDKFNSILKDVKGLGLLTDENIKTDDVTDKFFDIESRLRLLRFEESRLEEYLKKIDNIDNIFKTERQLTDIRHEIEQLTGNLNKLSNLVKLSTITINMNEKVPKSSSEPPEEPTYLSKLKENFLDSLSGVIEFLGNLLLFIVAILPSLVVLGIVIFVVYLVWKKRLKNKIKKPLKSQEKVNVEYEIPEEDIPEDK